MKTVVAISILITFSISFAIAQDGNKSTFKFKDKPIVQVMLNGKKTWALLDTGSDITILNLKHKDRYNFHATQELDETLRVAGFGSKNNYLYQVTGAQLYFDDVKLKSSFYAYDITSIANSIRARTGKSITAILGTNLMRMNRFVIDLGNNEVHIQRKSKNRGMRTKTGKSAIARVY